MTLQTITLRLPEALYHQVDQRARQMRRSVEEELVTIVSAALPQPDDPPADFAREVAAFEQLRPALQAQYGGRVVAIYHGQVVATGDDKMTVLDTVLSKLGPVPCYIEWVTPDTPRRVRAPLAWVVR